jgi:hypothetical protein
VLGRTPEEAASETGHKSGRALRGYAQNGLLHQQRFDLQWQNHHLAQQRKFTPRVPLSQISPPPLSGAPLTPFESPISSSSSTTTTTRSATPIMFEETLDEFEKYELFCARYPNLGHAELFKKFQRLKEFERLSGV